MGTKRTYEAANEDEKDEIKNFQSQYFINIAEALIVDDRDMSYEYHGPGVEER